MNYPSFEDWCKPRAHCPDCSEDIVIPDQLVKDEDGLLTCPGCAAILRYGTKDVTMRLGEPGMTIEYDVPQPHLELVQSGPDVTQD